MKASTILVGAGRRIDAPGSPPASFPPENESRVVAAVEAAFGSFRPHVVIASAACGGDILILEAAHRRRVPFQIILPFAIERFRRESVTDRGKSWGSRFDTLVKNARGVVTLGESATAESFAQVNEAILDLADELVPEAGARSRTALVVWEGCRKVEADYTADFLQIAWTRRWSIQEITTVNRAARALRAPLKTTPTYTPQYRRSREIRNGADANAAEIIDLAKSLRRQLAFREARELIGVARQRKISFERDQLFELMRLEVTCTYKDVELPPDVALPRALDLLRATGYDPDTTENAEALGLAGAVWKRWWEYDGQRDRLLRSLAYYRKAFGADVMTDDGYQAINAAYILDALGILELTATETLRDPRIAASRFEDAVAIRGRIVVASASASERQSRDYWYLATVAEAYVGLGDPGQAAQWLARAVEIAGVEDWQLESTARQLASVAHAFHVRTNQPVSLEKSNLWLSISQAFGEDRVAGLQSVAHGKLGLALSGGGFRASLYHIGVLARLAEVDALRHVEVLSCVSGGSIIGARYYLEVRQLLRTKKDSSITARDYIDIVQRVCCDFVRGVQSDLRNSLLADRAANLQSASNLAYTRTSRLGELIEERLLANVPDGEGDSGRFISQLYIEPARAEGEPDRPFNPRLENWRRRCKVPIMILNAASLNTGHPWQFTAAWMGEPESGYDPTIASTPRLQRIRYEDAPENHQRVPLGTAVAASACVPGIFEPIVMQDLFDEMAMLRLVDGGVFDNQGLHGLLDQSCTFLFLSDASGQLRPESAPNANPLSVAQRANNVLMARVREMGFREVQQLRKAGVLRSVAYVHLTQGLNSTPLTARHTTDGPDAAAVTLSRALTPYGMRSDIQRLLSQLRTDLDVFSDLEAAALMESGYRAIELALHNSPLPWKTPSVNVKWWFRDARLVSDLKAPEATLKIAREHLEKGARLAGRTLPLSAGFKLPLRVAVASVLVALMLTVIGLFISWPTTLAILTATAALGTALLIVGLRWLGVRGEGRTMWQRVSGRFMGLIGWRRARLQLNEGSPAYLDEGRLGRFVY